MSQRKDTG
jgi:hypothetical protein